MAEETNEYEGQSPECVLGDVLRRLRVLEFSLIGVSDGGFDHDKEDIAGMVRYLVDVTESAKKYLQDRSANGLQKGGE